MTNPLIAYCPECGTRLHPEGEMVHIGDEWSIPGICDECRACWPIQSSGYTAAVQALQREAMEEHDREANRAYVMNWLSSSRGRNPWSFVYRIPKGAIESQGYRTEAACRDAVERMRADGVTVLRIVHRHPDELGENIVSEVVG